MKTVLILNPISSPAYLSEKFKQAGFYTIACFTSKEMDYLTKPSIEGKLFDQILFLDRPIEQSVRQIQTVLREKNLNLVFAFSSSEFDLPYTDAIVQVLCPQYGNNPQTADWRCNKRSMNLQLQKNGTPATRQVMITDPSEIDWNTLQFPLVVKPAEGGMGSVGVTICKSSAVLQHYFDTMAEQHWGYAVAPEHFLLEEMLIGEEYVVDMVAWNRDYDLIGVYSAEKEIHNSHNICRYRRYLPPHDPTAKALTDYCCLVLRDLDVAYGMMHLECMMTAKGPRLIELNPRVSGSCGVLNYFSEMLTGTDQATRLIQHLQGQASVQHPPASLEKFGVIFYLQNFGFAYQRVQEERFQSLSSYQRHWMKIPQQPEPKFPKTLLDTVAFIIFVSDSAEQLESDLQQLIALEKSGEIFG